MPQCFHYRVKATFGGRKSCKMHPKLELAIVMVACLQVDEQKCSGEVQGLTTVTVRVALPTLPAASSAEYVTK